MFDEVYQSIMLVSYLYYFDNNLLLSSVVLSFKMCRDNFFFVTYHFYSTVILGNRVFIRKQQSAQNPILPPRIISQVLLKRTNKAVDNSKRCVCVPIMVSLVSLSAFLGDDPSQDQ